MCRRHGVSLIELLVVVGLLSLLVGLLMPAVQNVRQAAERTVCSTRLREIGLALHHHHDTVGRLPPGYRFLNRDEPYTFQNWPARLLPYLEQSALWDATVTAYRTTDDPHSNPPHVGYGKVVKAFLCPADGRISSARVGTRTQWERGYTSYLGVSGRNLSTYDGVLYVDSRVRLVDVTDGTSQTLMVGERPPTSDLEYGAWYAGKGQLSAPKVTGSADCVLGAREFHTFLDSTYSGLCPPGPYRYVPGDLSRKCDAFHFWSLHPGGANFAFCDGSVRFLKYAADTILPALATRSSGETVSGEY